MFKDPYKWLMDKGLIIATILINTFSTSLSIVAIVLVILIEDWIRKNWP